MIRNLLALVGLLGVALAAAVGLQAYRYDPDDTDRPRRMAVSYTGLDLATPDGVRTLERRIDRAIGDVCDDPTNLYRANRTCRDHARAGVRPQVDAAIARAQERAFGGYDNHDDRTAGYRPGYDPYPPAPRGDAYDNRQYDPGPPPPPPAYDAPPAAPEPRLRLVKRTVVTVRTVTTVGAPPAMPAATGRWHARPTRSTPRTKAYARRAPVANSWLPPAAWAAIDRATRRSFATGKLVRWSVAGRDGYVSVSPPRRIAGCVCRNVQAVKYAGGRQIVVADGLRCRDRVGR